MLNGEIPGGPRLRNKGLRLGVVVQVRRGVLKQLKIPGQGTRGATFDFPRHPRGGTVESRYAFRKLGRPAGGRAANGLLAATPVCRSTPELPSRKSAPGRARRAPPAR